MTLLKDTRNFLARERGWALLFIFLISLIAFNLVWHTKPEKQTSEAVKQLEQAETRLKTQIREAGGIEAFLTKRPRLMVAFNAFTFLLVVTLVLGIFINVSWVRRPDWRSRLRVEDPPDAPYWGLGTIFKVALFFISVVLAVGLLLSFIGSHFFPESGMNLMALVHTTVADFLCVGSILYFVGRQGGSWRDLGLKKIHLWEDLKIGIAGYAAILPFFFLTLMGVALLASIFSYEPPPHPLVGIFLEEEKRSPFTVVYSIFLACVAAPVLEEIFFRGFCYPAFKKRWGVMRSLCLSSAFFALIHENLFAFVPIFILGLGLGYLYEKRGTLFPSILLHIMHNSIFIAYFFLAKKILT